MTDSGFSTLPRSPALPALLDLARSRFVRLGNMATLEAAITGSASVVTVVIVGTSIGTGVANSNYEESHSAFLRNQLAAALPAGKTLRFVNLSYPGQDIGEFISPTFVGVASAGVVIPGTNYWTAPGWQLTPFPVEELWPNGSTVGRSWAAEAASWSPDAIFFEWGPNCTSGDANGYAADLAALQAIVGAWPKVPTVVHITNPLPTRFGTVNGPVWGPRNLLLDGNAIATRGHCAANNLTCVDLNHAMHVVRDGLDYVDQDCDLYAGFNDFATWTTTSGAAPTLGTGGLTFGAVGTVMRPQSGWDTGVMGCWSLTGSAVASLLYRTTYRLDIQNGTPGPCQSALYYLPTGTLVDSGVLAGTPGGANTWTVHAEVKGNHHRAWFNGALSIDILDDHNDYPGAVGAACSQGTALLTSFAARYGCPAPVGPSIYDDVALLGDGCAPVANPASAWIALNGDGIHHFAKIMHRVAAMAFEPFFAWMRGVGR